MTPEWSAELTRIARVPRLLVASDFDGTLAPICDHPADARILPAAAQALRGLPERPGVIVAIISGRSRQQLLDLLGDAAFRVALVGSHGAESPWDAGDPLHGMDLDAARRAVDDAALLVLGSWAEHKSASVAWHVRGCARAAIDAAWPNVLQRFASIPGARAQPGLDVLECLPAYASKREAMRILRARHQPDATVFLGDDVADAGVFLELGPADLGIAVGVPRLGARAVVPTPEHAANLLARLDELRAAAFGAR